MGGRRERRGPGLLSVSSRAHVRHREHVARATEPRMGRRRSGSLGQTSGGMWAFSCVQGISKPGRATASELSSLDCSYPRRTPSAVKASLRRGEPPLPTMMRIRISDVTETGVHLFSWDGCAGPLASSKISGRRHPVQSAAVSPSLGLGPLFGSATTPPVRLTGGVGATELCLVKVRGRVRRRQWTEGRELCVPT